MLAKGVNKKNGQFTEDDQNLLMSMADNIAISIDNSITYHDLQKAEAFLRHQNAELKQYIKEKYNFDTIIGNSKGILDVIKRAEQVSLTDSTVLIFGETGNGICFISVPNLFTKYIVFNSDDIFISIFCEFLSILIVKLIT